MKTRAMLSLSVTLTSLLFLSACGSAPSASTTNNSSNSTSATQTDNSKEKIELSWIIVNGGPEGQRYYNDDIIKAYEQKHPNVKININFAKDAESLIKQQLSAGGGPDIVTTYGPTTLRQLAAAGSIIPLDKYAKQYGWDKRFFPMTYPLHTMDGKLYGLPEKFETLVIYYNKDMFKQNGWQIPKSYNELLDLSKKIKDKGILPFAFGAGGVKSVNEWWVSEAINAAVGPDEFKKVLNGEKPWNSPEMEDSIKKLTDLWQQGYLNDKQSPAISNDDSVTEFAAGKAAMKMEGTWRIGRLALQKPNFEWGMFTMPSWKEGQKDSLPLAIGLSHGINAKSKYQDAAAEFLDWVESPDVVAKGITVLGLPPMETNLDNVPNLDPHYKEAAALIKEAVDKNNTGYASWTYWPPSTRVYSYTNIESVWLGQMDIKEYMKNLEDTYQKDKKDNKVTTIK